jgi:hypothetical protein
MAEAAAEATIYVCMNDDCGYPWAPEPQPCPRCTHELSPHVPADHALERLADLEELREIEKRIPALVRRQEAFRDEIVRATLGQPIDALSDRRDELLKRLWPKAYGGEKDGGGVGSGVPADPSEGFETEWTP